MKKLTVVATVLAFFFVAAGLIAGGAKKEEGVVIGVSMSTLANPYFVTMKDSGEETAKKLGVTKRSGCTG